jgi:hypothetical protein
MFLVSLIEGSRPQNLIFSPDLLLHYPLLKWQKIGSVPIIGRESHFLTRNRQRGTLMTTRNEYVENMKAHLDQWNKEIAQWEAKARVAKVDMRIDYEMHLEALRKQRDEARQKLDTLQKSAGEAWLDLTQGADEAWTKMREAIEKASTHFSK